MFTCNMNPAGYALVVFAVVEEWTDCSQMQGCRSLPFAGLEEEFWSIICAESFSAFIRGRQATCAMWSGTILAHLWEDEWVRVSAGSWHTLVCSACVPSCLTAAHFFARNKSCIRSWVLPPKYVKTGGKGAAWPLNGKQHSRLQAGVRCSWCSTLAHVLVPVDQVMGSTGLQWCL